MQQQQAPFAIYAGLALSLIGFVLIALAWNGASELDYVQGQFPFLISGGLTGMGLIVVGVGMIIIQTMRAEADDRARQLDELADSIHRLRVALAPPDEFDPEVAGEYRPRPRAKVQAGVGAEDATQQLPPASGGDESWQRPS
jgi:hypothetical protein